MGAKLPRKKIDPSVRAEIGRKRRAQTRAKIFAAAFDILGDENGLYARIEDVAEKAGVTRATFYNHFADMAELRDALTREVTHSFLTSVTNTIKTIPDARERSAFAVRFYLRRALSDQRWGWSMVNVSATGQIFGSETYHQAEVTIQEGIDDGVFQQMSSKLGRDILLGTALAAMGSIVREEATGTYPESVAGFILHALGVEYEEARAIAHLPMPDLVSATEA